MISLHRSGDPPSCLPPDTESSFLTEYIEIFYNQLRRQARLNYLSPAACEQMYCEKIQKEKLAA